MNLFPIQKRIISSLLIVTPLGFIFKFYTGPWSVWFNNYGAGLLNEIFRILMVFLFFHSRRSGYIISVCVFIITCIFEFLQLWHASFLELIRSNFVDRALIGITFSWWDLPHYFLGCMLGLIWIRIIMRKGEISE